MDVHSLNLKSLKGECSFRSSLSFWMDSSAFLFLHRPVLLFRCVRPLIFYTFSLVKPNLDDLRRFYYVYNSLPPIVPSQRCVYVSVVLRSLFPMYDCSCCVWCPAWSSVRPSVRSPPHSSQILTRRRSEVLRSLPRAELISPSAGSVARRKLFGATISSNDNNPIANGNTTGRHKTFLFSRRFFFLFIFTFIPHLFPQQSFCLFACLTIT